MFVGGASRGFSRSGLGSWTPLSRRQRKVACCHLLGSRMMYQVSKVRTSDFFFGMYQLETRFARINKSQKRACETVKRPSKERMQTSNETDEAAANILTILWLIS